MSARNAEQEWADRKVYLAEEIATNRAYLVDSTQALADAKATLEAVTQAPVLDVDALIAAAHAVPVAEGRVEDDQKRLERLQKELRGMQRFEAEEDAYLAAQEGRE